MGRRTSGGVMLALVLSGLLATGAAPDHARPQRAPEGRAARRQWALARMDGMANEGLRCRARFKTRSEVEACEAEFARRFRQYNEMYLEAARE